MKSLLNLANKDLNLKLEFGILLQPEFIKNGKGEKFRMGKIVYLNKVKIDAPLPAVNFTLFNAYGLAQAGAECFLIVQKGDASVDESSLYRQFNLSPLPNLHITAIQQKRYLGIKTNQWFYWQALKKIHELHQSQKIDIIITRDPSALPYVAWFNWKYHIKKFYQPHNFYADLAIRTDEKLDNKFKYQLLERVFIPRMNGLLCLQESQARLYQKYFPNQKIYVAKPGLIQIKPTDNDRFKNRLIGYVGSLQMKKGVSTLLDAFNLLKEHDFQLVLIGGRNDKEIASIREKIAALNLSASVRITGWIPFREVETYLDQISVGIIPLNDIFYNRYLTAPNKLFDYLSRGIPIIASDLPAIKDFMTNNVEGILFPPENAERLAAAILEIFTDIELYRKYSRNSLDTAREFLWEKRGAAMLKMMEDKTKL